MVTLHVCNMPLSMLRIYSATLATVHFWKEFLIMGFFHFISLDAKVVPFWIRFENNRCIELPVKVLSALVSPYHAKCVVFSQHLLATLTYLRCFEFTLFGNFDGPPTAHKCVVVLLLSIFLVVNGQQSSFFLWKVCRMRWLSRFEWSSPWKKTPDAKCESFSRIVHPHF